MGAATPKMSDSDRAFLLAAAAWAERPELAETASEPYETAPHVSAPHETTSAFLAGFRGRLSGAWLQTLLASLDRDGRPEAVSDRGRALDTLRKMHQAMAAVDLARVHPTWLVRALLEESPAVQRLVTASFTGAARHRVQAGLLLDSRDLVSERSAAPEVASWVMGLWTERLIGGEPERPDDPPALIVLVRLTPRAGYRLCRMAGFCKLILAGEPPHHRHAGDHRTRYDWLAGRLANVSADVQALARRDVASSQASRLPARHQSARIGLTTIARLLADIEPFRLRWALQHWPYPVAKLIRSLLPSSPSRPSALLESESLILRTAWDRLNFEGRLETTWPGPNNVTGLEEGGDPFVQHPIRPESSFFNKD
jgi:hypothetical protein